jgi:hypothetical protein
MSVSAQPDDAGLNETFTAEVTVNPAGGEIYAASYDLYFDTTVLEAIEQTQGDFLSQGGAETYEYLNEINNTRGKITYVETRTGSEETVGGATETGLLASITFKVIGTGISDLILKDMQFDDLTAEPEPTSTPDSSDDDGTSSSSGGSFTRHTPDATTPPTPTETLATEYTIKDNDSDASPQSDKTIPAESTSTISSEITPSSPKSAIPGFAAVPAIIGLLAVVVILRSRGE